MNRAGVFVTLVVLITFCGSDASQSVEDLEEKTLWQKCSWYKENEDFSDQQLSIRNLAERLGCQINKITTFPCYKSCSGYLFYAKNETYLEVLTKNLEEMSFLLTYGKGERGDHLEATCGERVTGKSVMEKMSECKSCGSSVGTNETMNRNQTSNMNQTMNRNQTSNTNQTMNRNQTSNMNPTMNRNQTSNTNQTMNRNQTSNTNQTMGKNETIAKRHSSHERHTLSTSKIVGITVGVILGVILLVTILLYKFCPKFKSLVDSNSTCLRRSTNNKGHQRIPLQDLLQGDNTITPSGAPSTETSYWSDGYSSQLMK
ncbi:uncharacterized protein [Phyllobates terribilis]|uniref:uncharacterized protein n=1 Tax=Phyllobates terribilis TaxID=111132 RepID=UPI003CCA9401